MFNRERASLAELLDIEQSIDQGGFLDVATHVQNKLGVKNLVYFSPSIAGYSYVNPYCEMTYKPEWETRYRDAGYIYIDPVFQKGINSVLPLDWANLSRSDKTVEKMFGEAEDFGVGQQGLTIPVRFPNSNMSALFTVTADVSTREWDSYRKNILREAMIYAHYFHTRVHDRLSRPPRPVFTLTKREREVVLWASEGKTVEDIATILSISRETAKAHLGTIRQKTNALNTTHAVSILYRHGLIA